MWRPSWGLNFWMFSFMTDVICVGCCIFAQVARPGRPDGPCGSGYIWDLCGCGAWWCMCGRACAACAAGNPHRSPHRSLGIPRIFRDFSEFFGYFQNFWSNIRVLGQKYFDFWASPTKIMQNHYVISSKYHFWTWNVPNWTKSLKSDMSGPAKTCFTK